MHDSLPKWQIEREHKGRHQRLPTGSRMQWASNPRTSIRALSKHTLDEISHWEALEAQALLPKWGTIAGKVLLSPAPYTLKRQRSHLYWVNRAAMEPDTPTSRKKRCLGSGWMESASCGWSSADHHLWNHLGQFVSDVEATSPKSRRARDGS